jgi:hypothetical protein
MKIGEQAGPLTFFRSSPLRDYRPLQSIVYWVVGRWAIENPFGLIHILNFVSFAFYALVFALWLRETRLPVIGVLGATSVLFLHPVLAGPLADLDGFTRLVVSGWVWLGAYFAFRYADRARVAIPFVSACFVIGLGFMEYAVGLMPLSVLAFWWNRRQEGARVTALALGGVLLVLLAGYYLLRLSVIGHDAGRLSLNPLMWTKNFVMLAAGVLFMGNTVSIYTEQSVGSFLALGLAVTVMTLVVVGGLWLRCHRGARAVDVEEPKTEAVFTFVAAAFLASFMPMVFMRHISEIYASAIVTPFALLTGYAAAGWRNSARPYFIGFLVVFSAGIAWACISVTSKVASLRQTGERASAQIQNLLTWIPSDADGLKIALVFVETELPPRRTYSVFRAGDDHLMQPGSGARSALGWFRPGENIAVSHHLVHHKSEIKKEEFDMVLYWNPVTRLFEPLDAK